MVNTWLACAHVKNNFLLFSLPLLCCTVNGRAQLGIGGGFEYGTAAFVNKQFYIGRPSPGIYATISYCPPQSQLFPSVSFLLKSILVPVRNSYLPGQDDFATCQAFSLYLNYKRKEESHYSVLFMGIGVVNIMPEVNLNDKTGNNITLIDSGASHEYPMVSIGGRYMRRILPNGNFYLGIEANLAYIRMHSNNLYYLDFGNTLAKAAIDGDIIFPGVLVQLDYFFGRNDEEY